MVERRHRGPDPTPQRHAVDARDSGPGASSGPMTTEASGWRRRSGAPPSPRRASGPGRRHRQVRGSLSGAGPSGRPSATATRAPRCRTSRPATIRRPRRPGSRRRRPRRGLRRRASGRAGRSARTRVEARVHLEAAHAGDGPAREVDRHQRMVDQVRAHARQVDRPARSERPEAGRVTDPRPSQQQAGWHTYRLPSTTRSASSTVPSRSRTPVARLAEVLHTDTKVSGGGSEVRASAGRGRGRSGRSSSGGRRARCGARPHTNRARPVVVRDSGVSARGREAANACERRSSSSARSAGSGRVRRRRATRPRKSWS